MLEFYSTILLLFFAMVCEFHNHYLFNMTGLRLSKNELSIIQLLIKF